MVRTTGFHPVNGGSIPPGDVYCVSNYSEEEPANGSFLLPWYLTRYCFEYVYLDQIASLFEKIKSTVSRHIKNIFSLSELEHLATVAKNETVQTEGTREIQKYIEYYKSMYLYLLDIKLSQNVVLRSENRQHLSLAVKLIIKECCSILRERQ